MVVLKLFAAINEEKQAPGKAARVRPIITMANSPGESFFSSAAVIWTTDGSTTPEAWAPAITMHEMPAVRMMAMTMPTMPPMLTSLLFRLPMQISTPAAPAVAKKPTIALIISNMALMPPPAASPAVAGTAL